MTSLAPFEQPLYLFIFVWVGVTLYNRLAGTSHHITHTVFQIDQLLQHKQGRLSDNSGKIISREQNDRFSQCCQNWGYTETLHTLDKKIMKEHLFYFINSFKFFHLIKFQRFSKFPQQFLIY